MHIYNESHMNLGVLLKVDNWHSTCVCVALLSLSKSLFQLGEKLNSSFLWQSILRNLCRTIQKKTEQVGPVVPAWLLH